MGTGFRGKTSRGRENRQLPWPIRAVSGWLNIKDHTHARTPNLSNLIRFNQSDSCQDDNT